VTRGLTRIVPRAARIAASRWLAGRTSAQFERDLTAMVARPESIVAGPWLGEVGFELLYWVPFLAWCAQRFDIPPDRWLIISRGGTASWYRSFAARYADVFDQVSPEVFRDRHDERIRELGEQKQTRLTTFDEQLIAGAAATYQLSSWSVLHPSRMYELLNPFWWGHLDSRWIRRHTHYARLPPPGYTDVPAMPARYVATKFYFNECFPPTDANRAFASDVLRALAKEGPVIALSTGLAIDDHHSHTAADTGVRHLPEGIDAARNLHVQDALVAGARAFVGTYGGFSYLAPFHHVPSYAFYSVANGFSPKHLALAQEAMAAIGVPGALHVSDAASPSPPLPLAEPFHRAR
jgi:hypothetical protein